MPLPFARTALATALLSASAAVFAQDPLVLGDTVVSAAGYEQKITDAPASISVVSGEELQKKRYSNLAQALEDVEGIDVRQGTGKTGGLNISIRGLPSDYTLILIDGRRQNTAGNVTPNGFNETSTSFMPPLSAIERIEVIRGPMSTLYGSDAWAAWSTSSPKGRLRMGRLAEPGPHLPGKPRLRRSQQDQPVRERPAGRRSAGPGGARQPAGPWRIRPYLRQ